MSDARDKEYKGPLSQDVVFEQVGESPNFSRTSSSQVEYLEVVASGEVLGFLWASDEADAAGFAIRKAAGGVANNAAVAWNKELTKARANGLSPVRALQRLAEGAGLGTFGTVSSGSRATAETSAALKAHAAEMA